MSRIPKGEDSFWVQPQSDEDSLSRNAATTTSFEFVGTAFQYHAYGISLL